jgi:integrase/recombinase XerD
MSKRLRQALDALAAGEALRGSLMKAQGGRGMGAQTVVNWFFKLYLELGFYGCSSHSGRRTAITRWARKISSAGGSMRDVQSLAINSRGKVYR